MSTSGGGIEIAIIDEWQLRTAATAIYYGTNYETDYSIIQMKCVFLIQA